MKVIMFLGSIFIFGFIQCSNARIIAGVVVDAYSKEYLPSATLSINGKVISDQCKGVFSIAFSFAT